MLLEPEKQDLFVELSHIRMNQESQASLPLIIFFLDELIVSRVSPKLGRNGLLEQLEQVGAEVIHSLTGELLKAPDGVKVLGETDFLQRAPTVPRYHGRVIPVFDVEEKSRGRRMQGGEHKRINGRTAVIQGSRLLNQREHRLWNMHLVYEAGITAPK